MNFKSKLLEFIKRREVRFFLIVLTIVVFFTAIGFATYGYLLNGTDDANITFVYSRNLANGNGIVYNVGGERVEGSSTMLWMLIVAVLFKITSKPEILILILNILILSSSLTYLFITLFDFFKQKFSRSRAIFFLALTTAWITAIPNFILWGTISLMEFGLYTAIILSLFTIIFKSSLGEIDKKTKYFFYLLMVALALVRPESLLWGPVVIVLYFISKLYSSGKFKNSLKSSLIPLGIFVATVAGLTGFRLAYFGYPFPNTYYAKVSTNYFYNLKQGYEYFKAFIQSNSALFILLGLALILSIVIFGKLILSIRNRTKISILELHIFIISAFVFVGVLIPVINGGDNFTQYRFIQPVWPLIILVPIFAFGLINLSGIVIKQRFYAILTVTALAFFVFYSADLIQWHKYKEEYHLTFAPQLKLTYDDRINGLDFNRFFSSLNQLPSIAVVAAGGIKMTYQGETNDVLALNNVEMAHATGEKIGIKSHAAFNRDVFFQQKPQILNLLRLNGYDIENKDLTDLVDYWNSILKNLYLDTEFKELYTKAIIHNKRDNTYLFGFYRNDFFTSLDKNIFESKTYPI